MISFFLSVFFPIPAGLKFLEGKDNIWHGALCIPSHLLVPEPSRPMAAMHICMDSFLLSEEADPYLFGYLHPTYVSLASGKMQYSSLWNKNGIQLHVQFST